MEAAKDQSGGTSSSIIVLGPWGGIGGTGWDDGSYSGVREITLKYGLWIDSIRVVYDQFGKPVAAEKHGGRGGNTAEIKLQYPEEFLTSVDGYHCSRSRTEAIVIRSLTFKSNRRTFGPFGIKQGTPFSTSMDGGKIVGFNGRSGLYLDAIGFHWSRTQTPKLSQTLQHKLNDDRIVVLGPYGGSGGTEWDDGSFSGVRDITLKYGLWIDSIRVGYDHCGKPVAEEKHGGTGGNRIAEIRLHYPEEFLTGVNGYYRQISRNGAIMIQSLTFKSNRRIFGPFGSEEGTQFSSSINGWR